MSKWQELPKRLFSAIILGSLVIFCTYFHPLTFLTLLIIAVPILWHEWHGLNIKRSLAFDLAGILYIFVAIASLWLLRLLHFGNCETNIGGWVFTTFALVWATDIFAYFIGKVFGGPKLAPRFSPNKTWAGLLGGIWAAVMAGIWIGYVFEPFTTLEGGLLGAVVAIIGQFGDITESHLKRRAGVKDASNLIPGHGGLLDRVDALMAVAPIIALFALLYA